MATLRTLPDPPAPAPEPAGLRAQKKQRTRLHISEVATRMFIERGFDQVTIAEVAAVAQVSVNTVFNYFTTKEELFFDRAQEVEEAPSRMVRERRAGESALQALQRGLDAVLRGPLAASRGNLRPFLATIQASPALQARVRLLLERAEARLASTLAQETGARPGDPTARAAAAMITGLLALLVQEFQARVLRGQPPATYRPVLARMADHGFQLLTAGLGSYGRRAADGG
jgi:AcrR family transcriptional regulator